VRACARARARVCVCVQNVLGFNIQMSYKIIFVHFLCHKLEENVIRRLYLKFVIKL